MNREERLNSGGVSSFRDADSIATPLAIGRLNPGRFHSTGECMHVSIEDPKLADDTSKHQFELIHQLKNQLVGAYFSPVPGG